ncbi:single-stranded DNA-binding protein [Saccharopolyspora phatthalungensis]|uniref:Single-stranded DNA-binding protein n=1 Tax=Saccharopolyspora phatthalungensis TaxID=664693 RepID=A0A840Q403_9PSEU|nr:single-stranded DNA-binding protein [Saccharopolyspora phatthalungensis]MBB5153105.1 single-strand DNA-binding protein [Saccharopolyspora phatthalungensis]
MFETLVTVVGYVITEPVVRDTPNGNRVASFRVAATSRRFDRDAEEWVDGARFYATVNCWKRLADGVATALGKGDPVVATGRLRTREYERGGQWSTVVELEANAVGLDLARGAPPAEDVLRQRSVSDRGLVSLPSG